MAIVSENGDMPTKLGEQATTPSAKRKNASLGFFSNIFKRKRDEPDPVQVVRTAGDEPPSPCAEAPPDDDVSGGEEQMTHIEQDLQRLQMSRQDNPFLQHLNDSRDELPGHDQTDHSQLMVPDAACSKELALAEIHSRLVRSPPPTAWPRSQKFDFHEIHESARIVEVIPRSNLRPIASKGRGEVMDQCLQDILQTQRSLLIQKASTVDESFIGRLSPVRSPPRPAVTAPLSSPRRGRTLLQHQTDLEPTTPETRLSTPLAPIRPAQHPATMVESRRSLQASTTSFQMSTSRVEARPST